MATVLSPTPTTTADVLRAHGAGDAELPELLAYVRNAFDLSASAASPDAATHPLPDEPFVAAWARYAEEAEQVGAFEALRRRLVQLRFPVAAGTSRGDAYVAATRRGVLPCDGGDGLRLAHPESLRLFLHPTAAGRIPVVVAGARADFELLVQALTRRNEPEPIPASMGACIVGGYNNWDRVARLRREWESASANQGRTAWDDHFRREVVPRKELYQDRFILLSSGPYSATRAESLGLDAETWAAASLTIRLEHECAHYFTRRVFGSMRNSLLDELIADYAGIVAAAGRYRADWFLRFMGLEHAERYRDGGRLENYRGTPPLSARAFAVLQSLVRAAAANIERFERAFAVTMMAGDVMVRARVIAALARVGVEALASDGGDDALRRAFDDA